ncbi:MAG TPA: amphi-Trp domain-containing protein [bacterium]|nr:amphi-Trp domain-containing protein [bacterium]
MKESLHATASLPYAEAAELMNRICLGLLHGALIFRSGGRRFAYHLGGAIELKICAEENGGKGTMDIELRWSVPLNITTPADGIEDVAMVQTAAETERPE